MDTIYTTHVFRTPTIALNSIGFLFYLLAFSLVFEKGPLMILFSNIFFKLINIEIEKGTFVFINIIQFCDISFPKKTVSLIVKKTTIF